MNLEMSWAPSNSLTDLHFGYIWEDGYCVEVFWRSDPMCEGLMAGFSRMGASRIGEKLRLEVHLVEGVVGTRKITLCVIKRYHWEKVRDYRGERLTDDPYPGRVRGLLRGSEMRNVSESLLFLGIRIWAHDMCKRSPAGLEVHVVQWFSKNFTSHAVQSAWEACMWAKKL